MKRPIFLFALLLAACSNQEAGRSEYFETIGVAPPTPPTVALPKQVAPVTLGELRNSVEGRDTSPLTGDEALVNSLNAAIAQAGSDAVATTEPTPELPAENVQNVPNVTLPGASEEISDNSFQRVVERESIETDRQKLQELSKQRVELEAEPLPARTADVNLAAFARATSHKIGDKVYRRSGIRSSSRAASECRKYRNPDEAQRAFIAAGGPEIDAMRIDPDGDGFVCGWSPIPFRSLKLPG